jgi:hypothetical protein
VDLTSASATPTDAGSKPLPRGCSFAPENIGAGDGLVGFVEGEEVEEAAASPAVVAEAATPGSSSPIGIDSARSDIASPALRRPESQWQMRGRFDEPTDDAAGLKVYPVGPTSPATAAATAQDAAFAGPRSASALGGDAKWVALPSAGGVVFDVAPRTSITKLAADI